MSGDVLHWLRVAEASPVRAIILRRVAECETLVSASLDPIAKAEMLTEDTATLDALRRLQADLTGMLGRIRAIAHRLEHPRDGAP